MIENLVAAAGWAAMLLIIAAYYLVTIGRLSGQSRAYQWLNILGAAGFIINSGYNHAYPSAVLNVVWAGIAFYALRRDPVTPKT